MKVRYRFRCYPTPDQARVLERTFGCCRYVYNRALRLRTDAWQNEGRSVSYNDTSSALTEWKRKEETAWLNEVSCVPTQQALRHLNNAFVRFFNKEGAYPSFKRKHGKQAAEYTSSAFRWDPKNRNLKIAGLGRLKIRWSRSFTSKPTTVTITRSQSGKYHATLCLDEAFEALPKTGRETGVDLGVNRLATLSDGERIPNPKYLGRKLAHLRRQQRILSRKTKGSGRWKAQKQRVARIHERIADSRKDHIDKVTTGLVRRFDSIKIEDLNVRGMTANRKLARAISDVGMGAFRSMLEYKCERYGKELVVVDRFFPSSKRCSGCGHVVEKLPLSVREWGCPECHTHHDRDENAAKNICAAAGQAVPARGGRVRRYKPSGLCCGVRRSANRPETVDSN